MRKVLVAYSILFFSVSVIWASGSPESYADLGDAFGASTTQNTGLTSFPTLNVPMGGEYEGMGTAYTAVLHDASYFDANASGSSLLPHTELSFLHNNWIADTNIEGIVYTMRYDQLGLGVGAKFLHVPFTSYNSWGETPSIDSKAAKGHYTETVAGINVSYNFFHSYEFHGIAAGATVKFAYRNIPSELYSFKYPNLGNQSALAIMADLGILTRLDLFKFYYSRSKNFSLGLALKNFGPAVGGDPLPTMLSPGISYSPIRPLLFSIDVNIPFILPPPENSNPDSVQAEGIGFAVGTKVQITNFFAMLTGFKIKGGNPRVSIGSNIDLDAVSLNVNYTLDLTTQMNRLDRFSVQASVNLGDMGRASLQERIDNFYLEGLEAFAEGDYARAIDLFESALELDPTFTPAAETLETARRAFKLQNQIEEFQR